MDNQTNDREEVEMILEVMDYKLDQLLSIIKSMNAKIDEMRLKE
jgi:hypothetical protein